jgi:hypothetical protein
VVTERQVQIPNFQLLPLPVEEVAEGRVLLLLRASLGQTAGQEVAEVREMVGVRVVLEILHLLHHLKEVMVATVEATVEPIQPVLAVVGVQPQPEVLEQPHQTAPEETAAMEPHHPFLGRQHLMRVAVVEVGLLLREVLEVLEVEEVEQGMILLQAEEQPILEAVVEVAGPLAQVLLEHLAVQVSSSLNTSPNLITKSSNHQAHGLHLLALLRSST